MLEFSVLSDAEDKINRILDRNIILLQSFLDQNVKVLSIIRCRRQDLRIISKAKSLSLIATANKCHENTDGILYFANITHKTQQQCQKQPHEIYLARNICDMIMKTILIYKGITQGWAMKSSTPP